LIAIDKADIIGITPYEQMFGCVEFKVIIWQSPCTAEMRGLRNVFSYIARKVNYGTF